MYIDYKRTVNGIYMLQNNNIFSKSQQVHKNISENVDRPCEKNLYYH